MTSDISLDTRCNFNKGHKRFIDKVCLEKLEMHDIRRKKIDQCDNCWICIQLLEYGKMEPGKISLSWITHRLA